MIFTACDFVLGEGQSIVIVVPAHLPQDKSCTVSVSDKDVKFRAGFENIGEVAVTHPEVLKRLSSQTEIGIVEYPKGEPWPDCITAMAYVELRKGAVQ